MNILSLIMTRNILLTIAAVLCLEYCLAQVPKGKLFIIGGGSRPDGMVARIISEAGLQQGGYGIILPMSSVEPDSAVYYANLQFVKNGIDNVFGLHFEKGESYSQAKLDSIRNARLIYISGGDQNRFMDVVLGTDIEKAIHEAYMRGCLVGGTSAGAAVMSEVMITGNELKHPNDDSPVFRNIETDNIETKKGLGLNKNAIVDQHFVRRSRHNRLISVVIETGLTGIGIDERTAILVSGNDAEVIGDSQVILLENRKKTKTINNEKLGARGLEMSVLLPGDKFKIR